MQRHQVPVCAWTCVQTYATPDTCSLWSMHALTCCTHALACGVCAGVHAHKRARANMVACVRACVRAQTSARMHARMSAHARTYTHMRVRTRRCVRCVHACTRTCAHKRSPVCPWAPPGSWHVFFNISEHADGERRGPMSTRTCLETRLTEPFRMPPSDST